MAAGMKKTTAIIFFALAFFAMGANAVCIPETPLSFPVYVHGDLSEECTCFGTTNLPVLVQQPSNYIAILFNCLMCTDSSFA